MANVGGCGARHGYSRSHDGCTRRYYSERRSWWPQCDRVIDSDRGLSSHRFGHIRDKQAFALGPPLYRIPAVDRQAMDIVRNFKYVLYDGEAHSYSKSRYTTRSRIGIATPRSTLSHTSVTESLRTRTCIVSHTSSSCPSWLHYRNDHTRCALQ